MSSFLTSGNDQNKYTEKPASSQSPPKHIELAHKMTDEISAYPPSEQNEMFEAIRTKLLSVREITGHGLMDEIERKQKELEHLKMLTQKIAP